MLLIALGELVVVALIRPMRWMMRGQKTKLGAVLLRLEDWLLHHLQVMHAESRMRQEIDRHGAASAFLAENLTDNTNVMPSIDETVTRARRDAGVDHAKAIRIAEQSDQQQLGRGRYIESRGGDRSDDIREAMLRAQREQSRHAEWKHARRKRWPR